MIKKIMVIFGIFLVLTACEKPPADDMNKAIETLNRAENDFEAVTYAANTLNRARDALQKMQEEAASKRYESAKIYAGDVVTYAERAVSEGKAAAIRLRDEAANAVGSLQVILAETILALNTARLNNIQVDFSELGRILDAAKIDLENAGRSLAANNFQEAINKSQSIRSALGDITSRINEAARELSKKL